MPCNIMAAATGIANKTTPIKIMPPAMPRIPEMNDVTRTARATPARTRTGLIGWLFAIAWMTDGRYRPTKP